MTEKLRTLMDEVTGLVDHDFAEPDLETILRDGDRAVRRRRLLVGAAGLAAAAVATTGVVLAGGGGDGESHVADPPPLDTGGVSWAVGSTVRTPTSTSELSHPVRAYVRTAAGFVTVDRSGRVWSVVDGRVSRAGTIQPSRLHLVADPEDSLAAWLEPGDGDSWHWVVLDQATGERAATVPAGRGPDITGVVVALDDRQLYVKAGSYARIGVDDGLSTPLDRPSPDAQLLSVEDGVAVWSAEDATGSAYLVGGPAAEPVVVPEVHGSIAALSPDARWVSFDADEPRVYDAATGDRVDLDVDGRVFATGYEWLDEDSLAVIASRDEVGPIELLVCEVPSGSCGVTVPDLGSFDAALERGFALPTGTPVDE